MSLRTILRNGRTRWGDAWIDEHDEHVLQEFSTCFSFSVVWILWYFWYLTAAGDIRSGQCHLTILSLCTSCLHSCIVDHYFELRVLQRLGKTEFRGQFTVVNVMQYYRSHRLWAIISIRCLVFALIHLLDKLHSTVWLALDQIVFVWQKLPEQTKLVHLQFVKFTWPRRVDLLPPHRYRVLRNLPSRSLQKNPCMIIRLTTSQSTCAIFRDLSKSLLITKGNSSKLNFTKSERTITTRKHTGLKVN